MASNLRVDTILPSSGTTLGIGTASGTINFLGNSNLTTTGDITVGGNLGVGGTLTYEDVTNIDSVGLITARSGINISSGSLTIPDSIIHSGDINTKIRFPEADAVTIETNGSERLRINSAGSWGIGASFGTSGQVLTSQGNSSAPTWATPSSGLSMADQWRFKATQNITGSRQLLTGWERPDRSGTGGGAYVGSGMSVSSDIFSFPVTGIYLITLDWSINCSSNNVRYAKSEIEVTKNNSDYYQAAKAFIHINRPTGTSTGHTTSCNFIIDVDNTTNDKVKFTSSIDNVGDHQVLGDEDVNVTTVTFLRLGDT